MAGLRYALSNPDSPLVKSLDYYEKTYRNHKIPQQYSTTEHLIAQTYASDPTVVRLKVKERKQLSRSAVDQLVATYQAGGISQLELAGQFSVHVETVNRHIRRRRQATKLGRAVTLLTSALS